jgi:hypothetical protein
MIGESSETETDQGSSDEEDKLKEKMEEKQMTAE